MAASREQKVAEARACVGQVLTVVEHKKCSALGQKACDRTGDVGRRFGGQAQYSRYGVAYQTFVRNRREIHEPDPTGKRPTNCSRKFDYESSLANAGNPDERNQST